MRKEEVAAGAANSASLSHSLSVAGIGTGCVCVHVPFMSAHHPGFKLQHLCFFSLAVILLFLLHVSSRSKPPFSPDSSALDTRCTSQSVHILVASGTSVSVDARANDSGIPYVTACMFVTSVFPASRTVVANSPLVLQQEITSLVSRHQRPSSH